MKRKFRLHQAALLISAQAAGQVALLAATPVLTRHYSPSQFGGYQLANSVALLAQPVATLRLEFLIPVEISADQARRHFARALKVTTLLSLTPLLIGIVYLEQGDQGVADSLIMIAILLFVASWSVVDNAKLVRDGHNSKLAIRNFVGGVVAAPLQVFAALAGGSIVYLALATLVGRGVAILVTWSRQTVIDAAQSPDAENTTPRTAYGTRRAVATVVSGVLSNGSVYSLTLLASFQFGKGAAGQVGTAQRVTSGPSSLIGQALGQYFQGKASRLVREAQPGLAAFSRRFVRALAFGVLPVCVAMCVLGPMLAVPVLGAQWHDAGIIIAMLSVPTALQLVVSPTIPLLVMLGRESLLFRMQVSRLASSIVLGVVPGAITGNYLWLVGGYAFATVVAYIITLKLTLHCCHVYDMACAGVSRSARLIHAELYDGALSVVREKRRPWHSAR